MFMYGSILIAVTLRPVVLSSKPVEEAIQADVIIFYANEDVRLWKSKGSREIRALLLRKG